MDTFQEAMLILLSGAYIASIVVGIIGNCLVAIVLYRTKTMNTPMYIFILNLAIADFLVTLLCLPSTLVQYFIPGVLWLSLLLAYCTSLFLAVVGNAVIIIAIGRKRFAKSPMLLYLLHSVACQFIATLFYFVPAIIVHVSPTGWPLGSVACKVLGYSQAVSVCVAIYSMVGVSLERCISVNQPFRFPPNRSRKYTRKCIASLWISALITMLPWLIAFDVKYVAGDAVCDEFWHNKLYGDLYFIIVQVLIIYFVPIVIMSISYFILWRSLKGLRLPRANQNRIGYHPGIHRSRTKIIKMLIVVVLTFIIMWLPLYIILSASKLGLEPQTLLQQKIFETAVLWARWLGASNSSINPIIYAFSSKKFFNESKQVFIDGKQCIGNAFSFIVESLQHYARLLINNFHLNWYSEETTHM